MISLILMMLVLPQVRSYWPLLTDWNGIRAAVAVLELLFILSVALSSPLRLPSFGPMVRWLAWFWLLWSLLSLILSDHLAAALMRQSELLLHLLFFYVSWCWLNLDRERPAIVLYLLFGGYALYGFVFLYQWHATSDPEHLDWLYGMPGFPNIRHFAIYALPACALSLIPWIHPNLSHRAHLLLLVPLSVVLGILLWTGSRGAVVALLASTLFMLLFLLPAQRKTLYWALPSVFLGGSLFAWLYRFDSSTSGTVHLVQWGTDISTGRWSLWDDSWHALSSSPWFGTGPDGFQFIDRVRVMATQPHNFPLQFALDWGIPGMFALLLLILLAGWASLSRLRQSDSDEFPIRWGANLALISLFILGLVDGSIYHAHSLVLIMLLLAVALQPTRGIERAAIVEGRSRVSLSFFALLIAFPILLHGMVMQMQLLVHREYLRPVDATEKQIPLPESWQAQLVRAFPSNLDYLGSWIISWPKERLAEKIEWSNWAHAAARQQFRASYLYLEAQFRRENGDRPGMATCLQAARASHPDPALLRRIDAQLAPLSDLIQPSPASR